MDDHDPILESRALLEYETRETLGGRMTRYRVVVAPLIDPDTGAYDMTQQRCRILRGYRMLAVSGRGNDARTLIREARAALRASRNSSPEVPPCSD